MLLKITQSIFHASFLKLICAKLGILHLKYQSNFSCCENFRKYNGSLFVHNTCTQARTRGGVQGMHPPTRPEEVLT